MEDEYRLMLLAVVISFMGFITENVWLLITKGYIDNRSMLFPFLSGYGILVVGFYLLFGTPLEMRFDLAGNRAASEFVYYLLAFFTVSIGEILLGTFTEKTMGIIYWDYSWIPFHVTRYTSLPTSMGFALFIVVFMKYLFPHIMDRIALVPANLLGPAAMILFAVICLDTLHSFGVMYKDHSFYSLWRVDLFQRTPDAHMLFHFLHN